MPTLTAMRGTRQLSVKARLGEYTFEEVKQAIDKAAQSDFLNGKVSKFRADFDWVFRPNNFIKVLEGNYDNDNRQANNEDAKYRRADTAAKTAADYEAPYYA